GVVAGVLLAGERVDDAADGVDLLGDLRRGAPFGALEEEMLEKVGDPRLCARLVARAVLDPDADCRRGQVRELLGEHPDAVREPRRPHAPNVRPPGLPTPAAPPCVTAGSSPTCRPR